MFDDVDFLGQVRRVDKLRAITRSLRAVYAHQGLKLPPAPVRSARRLVLRNVSEGV